MRFPMPTKWGEIHALQRTYGSWRPIKAEIMSQVFRR
jgi:hypothetical protein